MVRGKDNSLIVEFEFVVDLDLAIYKFIRNNYKDSNYVNKELLCIKDEREIIQRSLARYERNILKYLIPEQNTDKLYNDLIGNDINAYKEVLSYAKAYDTFPLMITYLREASSVSIDIFCKNEIEQQFIYNLNPNINTVIYSNRKSIPLELYTAIYTKYIHYLLDYGKINGKHIYVPAAKYNMEKDKNYINIPLSVLYSDTNIIHIIDMYRYIKYRYPIQKED